MKKLLTILAIISIVQIFCAQAHGAGRPKYSVPKAPNYSMYAVGAYGTVTPYSRSTSSSRVSTQSSSSAGVSAAAASINYSGPGSTRKIREARRAAASAKTN